MVQLNEMQLTCRGGGVLVKTPPLFSHDSKYVYLVWKNRISCYNTNNGEKVLEYFGLEDDILNIALHPINSNALTACSVTGDIITWNIKTGIDILKLSMFTAPTKIQTFNVLSAKKIQQADDLSYRALVSFNKTNEENDMTSFGIYSTKKKRMSNLSFFMKNSKFRVAIGGYQDTEYIGIISDKKLYYFMIESSDHIFTYNTPNNKSFTCIACHPEQTIIATGDTLGRVIVWNNLGNKTASQTVYHWHNLPVTSVCFSQSGSFFYSGGSECVLVKWLLNNTHQKHFVPRLPASVRHIAVSPQNTHIAVSLANNGIHILDSNMNLKCLIQQLVLEKQCTAGLHLDPRTKSLVLNGYVGHVQFYSPLNKSLLYNLDIVGQNKISDERNCKIINTKVTHIAISQNGTWLATIESRYDERTAPEVRLKFLNFDSEKQIFVLNTCVDLPHENDVYGIRFQPNSTSDALHLVSIGGDCKFKLWSLVDTDSIYKSGKVWECSSVGFYRDLPTNALAFSVDGSLLGVAFEDILTTWTLDPCELKCSLIHLKLKAVIKQIHFGTGDQCHLVVTISRERLNVWNLLTLTVVWSVNTTIDTLCVDPITTYMAAFTSNSQLFVFCPSSPKPIFHMANLYQDVNTKVVAAVFVPRLSQFHGVQPWQQRSKLYFIDSNQELYSLDEPNENDYDSKLAEVTLSAGNETKTPFGAHLAKTITTEVTTQNPIEHFDEGISADLQLKNFLDMPPHTMPPMHVLCISVLKSLVLSKRKSTAGGTNENSVQQIQNASDNTADSELSEDEEFKALKKRRQRILNQIPEVNTVKIEQKKENLRDVLKEKINFVSLLLD